VQLHHHHHHPQPHLPDLPQEPLHQTAQDHHPQTQTLKSIRKFSQKD
jgi:hypothetical protein